MNFGLRNDVASMAVPTYRRLDGTTTSGQSKAQAATRVSSTQEGRPESNAERTFQIEDEKAASAGRGVGAQFRGREVEWADGQETWRRADVT